MLSNARNNAATKLSFGLNEITKRVLCMLSCVIELIASVVTLTIINQVKNTVNRRNIEYEDADSYRGAAIGLMCVSSAGILYSIPMIFVRRLYLNSIIKKHFDSYLLINATLCVVLALCLLAGGVVSAYFSAADHELSPDICTTTFGKINEKDEDVCTNILKVKILEGVSASLSFISVLPFGSLFILTLGSYPKRNKIEQNTNSQSLADPSNNPPPYSSTELPPSYYESVTPPSHVTAPTNSYTN